MIVTQIIELDKKRSKVYIETEFAFVLYKGELRLYHIREGEELSQEDYQKLVTQVLPKRAKLRAMNLLKSRDYTKSQLRIKLQQGFYKDEIIEEALEYVESFHYIDDLRYAEGYITYQEQYRSKKRIEMDLQRKGIDKETLQKAWANWEEKGGNQNVTAMIQKLIDKKHYDINNSDYKEQQKMFGFLLRKGFTTDQIKSVMKQSFRENDNIYD